jgi:hypothetical protein
MKKYFIALYEDFLIFVSQYCKPKIKKKMTLDTTHEIGETVTDPKTGKTGTITAAHIVFTVEVPEQIVPAETLTDVELA